MKISIIGSGTPVLKMACITLNYILYDNVPPFHSSSSSKPRPSLFSYLTKLPSIIQYSFIPSFRVLYSMAHPQEVAIANTGITVLNPELAPSETLVEYDFRLCGNTCSLSQCRLHPWPQWTSSWDMDLQRPEAGSRPGLRRLTTGSIKSSHHEWRTRRACD